MSDLYATWRALLAGERAPLHESEPACGFYRLSRSKDDKTMVGVAIWAKDAEATEPPGHDGVYAMRDNRLVDVERVWPFCARYPVTEEAFRAWETAGVWPDDHPVTAPAIGHNSGDDIEVLRDQIESASAGASDYAAIDSDEKQAKAQSLRARLLELGREADKQREAEKRPHLEAGKAVDAKFQPLVKAAKTAADQIAKAMSAWETLKARRAAETQRKADEARRVAEEKARKAAEAGKPVPAPVLVPDPEPVPQPAMQVKGAYGRAASVRIVHVVTAITDAPALFAFLKDHPELKALMLTLAQRAVDKNFSVPGVTVEERRKVA
jgi:hypothetical protein